MNNKETFERIISVPPPFEPLLTEYDANKEFRRYRDIELLLNERKLSKMNPNLVSQYKEALAKNVVDDGIPMSEKDSAMISRYSQTRSELRSYMESLNAQRDEIKNEYDYNATQKQLSDNLRKVTDSIAPPSVPKSE